MNNLVRRTLTGFLYVFVMLAGTLIHPLVFFSVFLLILFFVQHEFYTLLEQSGFSPHKVLGLIFGLLLFVVCFSAVYGLIPLRFGLIIFIFLPLILIIELFRKNAKVLQNGTLTLLGFVYVAVPFSLMNFIVFPDTTGKTGFNPIILAGIYFIVWVYDSAAYLSGSKLGKHKLHKKISPQKTWEGFIVGTVFGVIMGIFNAVIFPGGNIVNWIIMAIIVVIFGTLGDLFESKIKRELNVKDSGNILPGHGGLLDRFDSLLFVIPFVFIWLIISENL